MSTRPDLDRSISAWLVAKAPAGAPDRLLSASREQVRTTAQRRAWWPGGRSTHVNAYARLAIGAVIVLVIAFVGINRLPTRNGNSSAPGMSPSPSPASSRSAATLDPSPPTSPASLPMHDAFPEPGEPVFGRYAATVGVVKLTFDVASHDWDASVQGVLRGIGHFDRSFGFWGPDRVNRDPCNPASARVVGRTAADLATAIASIPGIEVIGPTEATVGGLPAVQLDVTVPADLACPEYDGSLVDGGPPVELWSSEQKASGLGHAFGPGHRVLAWIVEVDGERVFIEADMSAADDAEVADEVRRIVKSIRFEEMPAHDAFPSLNDGPDIGKWTATVGGASFTFDISTHNWGPSAMSQMYGGGVIRGQDFDQSFGVWSPDWVNTDPCDWESGGRVGPKADDLAAAIASIPGIDVIGPTETTVGGRRAVQLDVTVPSDLACPEEGGVSLWKFDDPISCAPGSVVECNHLGSGMGHSFGLPHRILAWIVDVDGERIFIEADMSAAGDAEVADEVRRIVDSIRFEEP